MNFNYIFKKCNNKLYTSTGITNYCADIINEIHWDSVLTRLTKSRQWFICLHILLRKIIKKTFKVRISGILQGNQLRLMHSSREGPAMRECIPRHNAIIFHIWKLSDINQLSVAPFILSLVPKKGHGIIWTNNGIVMTLTCICIPRHCTSLLNYLHLTNGIQHVDVGRDIICEPRTKL